MQSKQALVPKLRFEDGSGNSYPDWKEKPLSDVSHNVMYGMNAAATKYDGVTKYIRITDIDEESHKFRSDAITSPDEEAADQFILHKGDIVFARTGASVGKSYLYNEADGNLAFAGFLIRFSICSKQTNPFFIFLQTQTQKYWKWVKVYSMRSGQPGINAEEYKTFPIHTPSLPEQEKIAAFLTSVDDRIDQLKRKKSLLQDYKKGAMQKLFSQELRFKDEQGKDFPDWEEKCIGELYGERNEKGYLDMELLSVSIKRGVSLQSEGNKRDSSNSDKSKYKRVLVGDIAYNSMRMWQGASAVSRLDGIVSPAYTILKNSNKTHSPFYGYLFKMNSMIQIFQRYSQGLTSDTWNLKYPAISKIRVVNPSLPEQTKIANFLSSLDQKLEQIDTQITQTQSFKKGLLQQMFV